MMFVCTSVSFAEVPFGSIWQYQGKTKAEALQAMPELEEMTNEQGTTF